jgi:hypothetical protein
MQGAATEEELVNALDVKAYMTGKRYYARPMGITVGCCADLAVETAAQPGRPMEVFVCSLKKQEGYSRRACCPCGPWLRVVVWRLCSRYVEAMAWLDSHLSLTQRAARSCQQQCAII